MPERPRVSEQRLRTFVDHATDAFFLLDEKLVVIDVNRRACESLGYTRDELVGLTPTDLDADVTPVDIDDIDRRLDTSETVAFESRHRRKDGSTFPVEVRAQAFRESDRRFTVALARDIGDQKRAEEALRLNEQRYRSLIDATAAIVWTLSASGLADESEQPSWTAFTGQTKDQYAGWGWLDSIHPEDRDRTLQLWSAAVAARSFFQIEYRVRRRDGEYRSVLNRAVPIFAENGELREWFGICIDITDLKQAEEKLRESEHRWRSLAEALPQLVWTAAPDGACDYFSSQWTQHTGVPSSRLLGWLWLEVLHPDDREPTRQFWTDSVAGRGAYDVEYRVRRLDGEYRWFKTRGVPIRDSKGDIFKWFGTCTDITDGKMAEEELRLAKETAESANRAKDEFLANVSHEVCTPLNAILGMTELALDTPLAEDQRQYLKTVKSAGENLLDMINDLLDFSKIEAGKLELDPADFPLRAVLADTLRVLAMRAHRKGLELVS